MSLGSFVSAISAGLFATFFGRKAGLWFACALNAVAVAIQLGSTSASALYIGRLILGLANGYLTTFSTVYATEAAPAHLRG